MDTDSALSLLNNVGANAKGKSSQTATTNGGDGSLRDDADATTSSTATPTPTSRHVAATHIQRVARGRQGRQRALHRKHHVLMARHAALQEQQRGVAATQIQRVVRGQQTRSRVRRTTSPPPLSLPVLSEPMALVNTFAVSDSDESPREQVPTSNCGVWHPHHHAAAVRIQSVERGRVARRHVHTLRLAHMPAVPEDDEYNSDAFDDSGGGDTPRPSASDGWQPHHHAAAVRIQSVERGRVARRHVHTLRRRRHAEQCHAATRIQAVHRGRAARHHVARVHAQRQRAAIRIQCAQRARCARHRAGTLRARREHAATRIQALHRGHQARRLSQEQRERNRAAIMIQCAERARMARRHAAHRRVANHRRTAAATRIQAAHRGAVARRRVAASRRKMARQREWEARERERERAVIRIQCAQRARTARRRVGALRVERHHHHAQRRHAAATRIQAVHRGRRVRLHQRQQRRLARALSPVPESSALSAVQEVPPSPSPVVAPPFLASPQQQQPMSPIAVVGTPTPSATPTPVASGFVLSPAAEAAATPPPSSAPSHASPSPFSSSATRVHRGRRTPAGAETPPLTPLLHGTSPAARRTGATPTGPSGASSSLGASLGPDWAETSALSHSHDYNMPLNVSASSVNVGAGSDVLFVSAASVSTSQLVAGEAAGAVPPTEHEDAVASAASVVSGTSASGYSDDEFGSDKSVETAAPDVVRVPRVGDNSRQVGGDDDGDDDDYADDFAEDNGGGGDHDNGNNSTNDDDDDADDDDDYATDVFETATPQIPAAGVQQRVESVPEPEEVASDDEYADDGFSQVETASRRQVSRSVVNDSVVDDSSYSEDEFESATRAGDSGASVPRGSTALDGSDDDSYSTESFVADTPTPPVARSGVGTMASTEDDVLVEDVMDEDVAEMVSEVVDDASGAVVSDDSMDSDDMGYGSELDDDVADAMEAGDTAAARNVVKVSIPNTLDATASVKSDETGEGFIDDDDDYSDDDFQ